MPSSVLGGRGPVVSKQTDTFLLGLWCGIGDPGRSPLSWDLMGERNLIATRSRLVPGGGRRKGRVFHNPEQCWKVIRIEWI